MGFPKYTIDDYDITRDGKIISKKSGKEIKPQPNGKGYLRVGIGGKLMFVHRLVAERYVPNPDNKSQVNHKDGNKSNNNADNLEWATNQENRNHAVKNGLHTKGDQCSWSKLTQKAVDFIREHTEYNSKELAEIFNVSDSHIREIRRNESWKN